MPKVDIPVGTSMASIEAEFVEYDGYEPMTALNRHDDSGVKAELTLQGLLFNLAKMDWEFTLRIQGNPYTPTVEAPDYIFTAKVSHNGNPGGGVYTYPVEVKIPADTLDVPNGKSQSYELTLEVVALDDVSGAPFGMAGFVDLGEIMAFEGPNY